MGYRQEIETTEELAQWYDQKYTEMGDGWYTPPEESNKHLDDLGVPFDQKKWLLDVGCGAGHFLAEAEKRVQCVGMEISPVAIRYAKSRLSPRTAINIKHMSIEQPDLGPDLGAGMAAHVSSLQYDYITSIGSLEHIVNLDKALDNIRMLLEPTGKWYFYCPNERWQHFDQPNERTHTDDEWRTLFEQHGLHVLWSQRWGDNTAFCGQREDAPIRPRIVIPPHAKINAGSGQRPFDQKEGWINIDIQERWNPDLIANWNNLSMFPKESVDMVVSHHSLEHVGCGEGNGFIKEAYRVLKPDGRLLIFVPDMRALAQRWLMRQIDTQIYMTNVYGAYMGEEGDRHRWGYDGESLWLYLKSFKLFKDVHVFNWRTIPGADIAKDFWILGMEAVK